MKDNKKKQLTKGTQRFQRRAKTSHTNANASFVSDIILSLGRTALHGEHFAVCCQESRKKVLSVE